MQWALIALVSGTAAAPPADVDWWLIGANARSAMFVDRSSIKRDGDQATQRVAMVMPAGPVRRIEVSERLDCRQFIARDLDVTYQLSNGARLDVPAKQQPRRLVQGTIGRATFDFACGSDRARSLLGTRVGDASLEEIARLALGKTAEQ